MDKITQEYRKAVEEAIHESHKKGLPAYQCRDGYIIAIYPNGREVRLQKVNH